MARENDVVSQCVSKYGLTRLQELGAAEAAKTPDKDAASAMRNGSTSHPRTEVFRVHRQHLFVQLQGRRIALGPVLVGLSSVEGSTEEPPISTGGLVTTCHRAHFQQNGQTRAGTA